MLTQSEEYDLADLKLSDIPEAVLAELQTLASRSEMSVEDYASDIICDAVAEFWHYDDNDITIAHLQANLDAILRVVEREPVFVVKEDGQRYVLVSAELFDRISGSSDSS